MRLSSVLVLGFQLSSVIALPAPQQNPSLNDILGNLEAFLGAAKKQQEAAGNGGNKQETAPPAVVAPPAAPAALPAEIPVFQAPGAAMPPAAPPANEVAPPAAAPPAEGAAPPAGGEEEEKKEGEVELEAVFGTALALGGGDIKQDAVFTPSAIGKFEYEFQGKTADTLTVVENKTPAAPPAGFAAIEPSSFRVSLATSKGAGLTLSKIDYIFDGTNAALAAVDLTKTQVGKLCTETNTFIIDAALGELEFELEENEVTLNLNKAVTAEGEWGFFVPVAAAAAPPAEAAPPAAAPPAVAPPAAGEEKKAGEGKKAGESKKSGEGKKSNEGAEKKEAAAMVGRSRIARRTARRSS